MSRLEEVVGIYEQVDEMTNTIYKNNKDNLELQQIVALANIATCLKNIDITLAILLDEKGAGHESN